MVQLYTKTTGGIGQNKYDTPVGEPIKVACNVYPLTTEEETAAGLQSIDTRKVVCDAWPGDLHCRVTFDGAEWDQHAPAKDFNKSWAARSVQLVIKKRG